MRTFRPTAATIVTSVLVVAHLAGCGRQAPADGAARTPTSQPSTPVGALPMDQATRLASIAGFRTPESVKYDPALGVWFVSNVDGNPSQKDGRGFISRLRSDGTVDSLRFVRGGRGGVTLDAPKGMAIVGDTLWVADIDVVRGFSTKTGAPVATIALAGLHATFLNDIAVGEDEALYVTDTGVRVGTDGATTHPGTDRIFRIAPGARMATVAASGDQLKRPNGIAWDAAFEHFVVGPSTSDSLYTWTPAMSVNRGQPGGDRLMGVVAASGPTAIAGGPGQYDGIEIVGDGSMLVSSWADSSVYQYRVQPSGQAVGTRLIRGVSGPADIGFDRATRRVAIPLFNDNRVEIWKLP